MDLLERTDFIEKCGLAVKKIAAACEGIAAIIGSPATNSRNEGKKLFNRAFVVSEGKILFTADKALVPTYDTFDEYRYFEPGKSFGNFEFKGKRIALTICEDLWDEQQSDNNFEKSRRYLISPMDELAKHKPDLIINISALPFSYNKIESKTDVFRNKAKKHHIPIVMVNQTGANTELIFDGASMVIDPNGEIVERLPFFEESVKSFELDEIANISVKRQPLVYDPVPLINKALVAGIRDYFGKTSIRTAVLGLSGGIDSALVLVLAAEALGPENVRAVLMPSRYSSNHSVTDSVKLAEKLGTPYDIISIEETFGAYKRILATTLRKRGRYHRREPSGPHQDGDTYGHLQQVRQHAAEHLQQKRSGGRIQYYVRRHGRRAIGIGRCLQDRCLQVGQICQSRKRDHTRQYNCQSAFG